MDLSVILPAYNVEKYLEKSIASILVQTGIEYEVIIVNDGSSDNTLNIAQKIAENHSDRVRVISTQNQGSGYARNEGIPFASGDYLYFMDPDDTIEEESFSKIFSEIKNSSTGPDIVLFSFNEVDEEGKITVRPIPVGLQMFYNSNDKIMADALKYYNSRIFFAPWTKFIRRDFLKNIDLQFTNQRTGQDAVFSIELFSKANTLLWIPQNFYCYLRARKGSAQSKKNPDKVLDGINIIKQLEKYIDSDVPGYQTLLGDFTVGVTINEILNIELPEKGFKAFKKTVSNTLGEFYFKKVKFSSLSFKRKILYIIRKNKRLGYLYLKYMERG